MIAGTRVNGGLDAVPKARIEVGHEIHAPLVERATDDPSNDGLVDPVGRWPDEVRATPGESWHGKGPILLEDHLETT